MVPPTPLSLLCAILLCLPLAIIFTFNSTTGLPGGAATPPLPIATSSNKTEKDQDPTLLPPPVAALLKPRDHKNQTIPNTTTPPSPRGKPLDEHNDPDDILLLQLASRVDPNPKRVKKVAFMFLTTSPIPFEPLWERFFARASRNLYNVYVHADPTTANHTFRGVFYGRVLPTSKPTRRHSPTLIAAGRRLLAHALIHDESNSMFALLSPSCIPIHSFAYTYKTLVKSRKSFIEMLRDEPGAYERWAARGDGVMLPELKYEDFRIGSQFWVLKRKHARIVVRDRHQLWSKFRLPCLRDDTCYPEEHYFPTLLSMADPRGCVPCTLTHVDWNGSHGGHPRMYRPGEVGPDLIWALRKDRPRYGDEGSHGSNSSAVKRHDPFLFARKFSPGSLHRLLSMANSVLFKD